MAELSGYRVKVYVSNPENAAWSCRGLGKVQGPSDAAQHGGGQPGRGQGSAPPELKVFTNGTEERSESATEASEGQTAPANGESHSNPPIAKRAPPDGLVLEQLIVGVLLFTPLLLLLPTTLVFYSFVSLLRGGLALMLGAARGLRVGLWYNPVYALALRMWRPAAFPAGVYFEVLPVDSSTAAKSRDAMGAVHTAPARHACGTDTTFLRLTSVPCSLVSLVLPCMWHMLAASGVPVAALEQVLL